MTSVQQVGGAARWMPEVCVGAFDENSVSRSGNESSEAKWHATDKAVQGLATYEDDPEKILKYYEFILHYSHLDETEQRLYAEYYAKEEAQMSSYVEQIKAEGRQQGVQQVLFKQLNARFGSVDEGITQRLKDASAEELDRWAGNILTAKTLDEVFQLQ